VCDKGLEALGRRGPAVPARGLFVREEG